jgi:hypothetical protein
VGVGVCGGHSDRPPDQVDRGLGLPALVFQDAHKVQGIGVVRRHSQYGVVNLPGFVQAAVLVTRDREENSLLEFDRHGKIDRRRNTLSARRCHNAILTFGTRAVVN